MSSASVAQPSASPRETAERGARSSDLRVLAWPGLGALAQNPYTWLLYSHLAEVGVRVEEFTPGRALRGGYDILHAHWPDKALNAGSWFGTLIRAVAAVALVESARLHGARVVWTAHNAEPHESRHPRVERWFWSAFVRRVHAVIHPSAAGRLAVEDRFPSLSSRTNALVAHGHFRGAYPDTLTRDDARATLAISAGVPVIAFVGRVREYKNVPHLVRTVRALHARGNEMVLLVAGAAQTPALAEETRAAAEGDRRIQLRLEHVPAAEVQRYLRAADLVVLPFTEITNSGSAVLALSFERPVLVPALGAMGELQALAGRDWVRAYEGELTPDELAAALEWATRSPRDSGPRLEALGWPQIAHQTLAVYDAARRPALEHAPSGLTGAPERARSAGRL